MARPGYAYVHFRRDNQKMIVPLSFIQNDFDINTFSTTRQYWVFWSNDGNDTPESYLTKNSGPIPRIENDLSDESIDAGYYRATISVAAESEEEIKARLEPGNGYKRVRQVTPKLLEQSFVEEMLKLPETKQNKRKKKADKDEEAERKKTASHKNVHDLLKYVPLFNARNDESEHTASGSTSVKAKSTTKHAHSRVITLRDDSPEKLSKKDAAGLRKSSATRKFAYQTGKKKQSYRDSDDDDSDNCPSPTKVTKLKEDVVDLQRKLENARKLNNRLLSVLLEKEEKIKALKANITALHAENERPCAKKKLPISSATSKGSADIHVQEGIEDLGSPDRQKADAVVEGLPPQDESSLDKTAGGGLDDSSPTSFMGGTDIPPPNIYSGSGNDPTLPKEEVFPSANNQMLPVVEKSEDETFNKDSSSNKLISKIKPEYKHIQCYELHPGKLLPATLMQYIFSKVAPGGKGTKIMALLAWGSKYLSEHSVSGGKDPMLSKSDPNRAAELRRDPLDKDRLEAVRRALIFKLNVEKVDKAEHYSRAKQSNINRFTRDKIKTLRAGLEKDEAKTLEEEKELISFF